MPKTGPQNPPIPAQGRFSTRRRNRGNQGDVQSVNAKPAEPSMNGNAVVPESAETKVQNVPDNKVDELGEERGETSTPNTESLDIAGEEALPSSVDVGSDSEGESAGEGGKDIPPFSAREVSNQLVEDVEPEVDEEVSELVDSEASNPVQDQLHENLNYEEVVSKDFKVKKKPTKKRALAIDRESDADYEQASGDNNGDSVGNNGGGNRTTSTSLAHIEDLSMGRTHSRGMSRPRKNRKHNWEQISKEFIEGVESNDPKRPNERIFYNMRELSERHGVGYQMCRARASKERWAEKKDAVAMRLAKERIRKRQASLVNKGVDFDDKAHKVAELGMGLITQRIAEIAQEVTRRRKIREDALAKIDAGIAVDKADLYSAVNYREMEGLASAAARFQEIGMKALGTDINKHEISGPDGDAIEVKTNIRHEISRDDPERVAALLSSLEDAGLFDLGTVQGIIDAEIVEEESPAMPEGTTEEEDSE